MQRKEIFRRLAVFATVTVLSALVLSLYPFYPLYLTIILALALGVVAFEFPILGLIVAILLSALGSMYQDAMIGLTFLFILILTVVSMTNWVDLALVAASWVLAFFTLPTLAIVPTVLAGLSRDRETALKIGAVSAVSVFVLSWTRNIMQAGLMIVPNPNNYAPKPIPNPWQFNAFIPTADMFSTTHITDYFAPLTATIGDYRIYVLIAAWAVAGYLVALLASKWKGPKYISAAIVGVLPPVVLSIALAQVPLLDAAEALIAAAILAAGYMVISPRISGPSLGVFTGLDELVPTGIPQKYSLLLGGPATDERNLTVEQFVQSGLKKKAPCFLLTTDTGFANATHTKFGDKLTVLVANPRATSTDKNLIPVQTGIQNLTSLNIELVKAVKDHANQGARICLDVLSEILLTQKLLTTRKWITDILPRLENWGFTTLGVFNPSLHTTEDVQGLAELFSGYVEIFEKDVGGRSRKLVAVRKMTNLRYNENELIIDRQQLSRSKGGLRERLSH